MKTHILIAERDARVRDLYQMFLEGCEYDVETAGDGLECVTKLVERSPAVLVLESGLHWTGADGVVGHLPKDWDVSSLPAILIDQEGQTDEFADLIAVHVVARLRKPFHMSQLLDRLEAAQKSLPDFVSQRS